MATETGTTETGRGLVRRWWEDAWKEGLWAAGWEKSLEVTAAQAAWRPQGAAGVGPRHSIWQNVLHMIFWREEGLRRAATGKKSSAEEVAAQNFPEVKDTSEGAWAEARRKFAESQRKVAEALAGGGESLVPLMYLLPHDCYHFGQINLLRGMQGLKAIE